MRWDVLAELIQRHGLAWCVEVGAADGRTMHHVLERCPKVRWVAVDPWASGEPYHGREEWTDARRDRDEALFRRRARAFGDRVLIRKANSVDAALEFADGSMDIVFIDAVHTYDAVKEDVAAWFPKVRSGGWMAGHDYGHEAFPGVARAVDELFEGVEIKEDRVWLVRCPTATFL